MANLLQGSRSTLSCVKFPSVFAFQAGMWGTPIQTGPTDGLPQCGNKRLCRIDVTPAISAHGSQMWETLFYLYTAWLLIESMYTGYSRLFPHQCKGCSGHVCTHFGTFEFANSIGPSITHRARSVVRSHCLYLGLQAFLAENLP